MAGFKMAVMPFATQEAPPVGGALKMVADLGRLTRGVFEYFPTLGYILIQA